MIIIEEITMNTISTSEGGKTWGKEILNKVPEITIFFWFIKVLCTTTGETAADFLNVNLNFGLTGTSIVTGFLLLIALIIQFKANKYIPAVYWSAIVLISVFGTLVTDNLTDKLGVPLETSTIVFSLLLAATFALWFMKEKTLSIHSIFTRRREAFYWLAILFTFALGTAAGDLMAEGLGLGYLLTGVIVSVVIATFAFAWRLGLNSVLSFWLIYILTRPLGASIGDLLSQPAKYGGLGLGATLTSVIFLSAILGIVVYLTKTKKDVIDKSAFTHDVNIQKAEKNPLFHVMVTLGVLALVSYAGYQWRSGELAKEAQISTGSVVADTPISGATTTIAVAKNTYPLGDMTVFKTITTDTLSLVNKGKMTEATARVGDLEHEWDVAQSRLKPMSKAKWTEVDDAIDAVLRQLRAVNPDQVGSKAALEALNKTLEG